MEEILKKLIERRTYWTNQYQELSNDSMSRRYLAARTALDEINALIHEFFPEAE